MTDLDLLIDAARQAGEIATRFTGPEAQVWDKPGGAGPVTEADLAVNAYLAQHLQDARPDYGWLSEESDDGPARLAKSRVFVIDPIDGTRAFVEGSQTWAHSLAVVEDGAPVAGVVYLPLRGKLYAAAAGQGATLNGTPLTASTCSTLPGADVLITKPAMKPALWPAGVPDVTRHHRPSLAYRMALVAEGRFDAMLTVRPTWEWDIAAGALLAAEAGATVTDAAGAPLRFNSPGAQTRGVLAAAPALHPSLLPSLPPQTT
ncbi:3'(2'),5'-bisphosphate nucleotidase CysQ [Pseudaestuariivita sp.]|uniref:3'(2'),5'-bisphosphate nucleotidase CysQ n=1 Tax=Pseudaestuariivita sp. TaxID=2211669 RepID=UPI004059C787